MDFACFQETKLENISNYLCLLLWAGEKVEWRQCLIVDSSGGLLCHWKKGGF